MASKLLIDLMMQRGFSLLELAIVVAISGLMMGYIIQINHAASNANCYASTKMQLNVIRNAIDMFARKNDRLPLPAIRNIGAEDPSYGREATVAQIAASRIDQVGGASFGAVPFQTLGLSPSFAGDCWGNKFTYVVTTALTTNASSGGFLDATVLGNIAQKTSTTITFDSATAYAVISHGADQLGAVKLNYSDADKGWCAGTDLKQLNCNIAGAVVANAVFNDGKDAGTAFFDDLVAAAGKPKILNTSVAADAYCWGLGTSGQLGDGGTSSRSSPVKVDTSGVGNIKFVKISTGSTHSCALTEAGKAYCWGKRDYGAMGDGGATTGNQTTPVAVSQGGLVFTSIAVGDGTTLALTASGQGYCWGYNGTGLCGIGSVVSPKTTPIAGATGYTFSHVTLGTAVACGVQTTTGHGYCWGGDSSGQMGNGAGGSSTSPTQMVGPGGTVADALTFSSISASYYTPCGITTGGMAYCWGRDEAYCGLGDGSACGGADAPSPVAVTGGRTFSQITTGVALACALDATDGYPYCWGRNQSSGKSCVDGGANTPFKVPGAPVITKLTTSGHHGCGLTSTGEMWCWGYNDVGQVGAGDTVSPTCNARQVSGSGSTYIFNTIETSHNGTGKHVCALVAP